VTAVQLNAVNYLRRELEAFDVGDVNAPMGAVFHIQWVVPITSYHVISNCHPS